MKPDRREDLYDGFRSARKRADHTPLTIAFQHSVRSWQQARVHQDLGNTWRLECPSLPESVATLPELRTLLEMHGYREVTA